MSRARLAAGCRLLLGLLFVWAALGKLADLPAFAEQVAAYRLLPPRLVPLVAVTLPGMELVAALALLSGWARGGGLVLISGMLVVFILAVGQALLRGIDLECGCFGGDTTASGWTLLRNLALLAAAGAALAWDDGRWSLAGVFAKNGKSSPSDPGGLTT